MGFLNFLSTDYSMINDICQDDILKDVSSGGRERPWKVKKEANELLCKLYKSISTQRGDYWDSKAGRLKQCSTWLTFDCLDDGTLKLANMPSCRVRLCPMCAWRRTLKISSNSKRIFTALETKYPDRYTYLFLTLTVPNCKSDKLSATIDRLMVAFGRLMDRREVKSIVKGWYRGLEVTHNRNIKSKSYDTYHPHYHVVLVVDKEYTARRDTQRGYITQKQWQQYWAESLGYFMPAKFLTQVDFVNRFVERFEVNVAKGKKTFSYKVFKGTNEVVKVKCANYPDEQSRLDLANKLFDRYIRSLYRPCKPKTICIKSSDDIFKSISVSCRDEYHCQAEKEFAVKKLDCEKIKVVKSVSGVSPKNWLKYYNFDYMQLITANRLMLHVDVRSVKPKHKNLNSSDTLARTGLINAICETTKYTVKDKDYIVPYDWDLSKDIVCTLDMALADRRLIAWGGLLAKVRVELKLDDEIDGDLVHIDDDSISVDTAKPQITYFWHVGYQQYIVKD